MSSFVVVRMRALSLALASSLLLIACSRGEEPGGPGGPGDTGFGFPDSGAFVEDSRVTPPSDGSMMTGPCGVESCGNGLDDDCDGVVDNDCFCVPGDESVCFRGPAEARGVGACVDGMMVCEDALEFGVWSDCGGDVLPLEEESCDGEVDDDCDGAIDEGCDCVPGSDPVSCGSDVGACTAGTQPCLDGMLGECEGASGPVAETCDGVDEDCDGMVDEGLVRACGSSVGECAMGTETCIDGSWDVCTGGRMAGTESCNGLDDDCDGSTDESLRRACGSAVGACMAGMQTCSGATWSTCSGETTPMLETCNGADDDCDGSTDESLMQRCGTDLGACTAGSQACTGGRWGTCAGETAPGTERCDGTLDEDCDGVVDEGCSCIEGRTRSCGSSVGYCRAGTETCSGGSWGTCTGGRGPRAETCNGIDDDCNGTTDDGLTRSCGTDIGACSSGTETCSGGSWGSCAGSTGPRSEACDGSLDEDCDGRIDEGCGCVTGTTRPCGTSTGACSSGTETCSVSGTWGACTGGTGPSAETCNGVDDDCDGMVDDGLMRSCGSSVGACMTGTQTCSAGSWGTCAGEVRPSTEVCDGSVDDDCDGTTDEGCSCTDGTTRSCGSSVGACTSGSQTCSGGSWGTCTGGTGPSVETCNGVDDDCDGTVDDGLTRSCGSSVGACMTGTETCSAGSWGSCVGSVGPSPEACDGVVDDDCDGVVDDGCVCVTGRTRSCGTNTGACSAGTETCDATGHWGSCTGAVGPRAETCNNVDDDCDGTIDDGLTRSCGTNTGACSTGTETCSAGSWGSCLGGVGPSTELCDGVVDEDCDGTVDDGCACTNGDTRSCGTNVGACEFGTERCNLMGAWGSCTGGVTSTPETCNGADDDCDGATDEGTCIFVPPVVMCPGGITAEVLTTVTLSSSGSDPDGGSVTYSWTVTSRPTGSTSNPSSPTSATTNFFLDASGTYQLEFCATDDEGDTSCCTVTVISEPPGILHVELQWSSNYDDVDLHLLNVTRVPDDGWFTSDDCYYANPGPDWGPAGAAANPTLDVDDRNGYGPENITIDTSPSSGTYNIGVHYFCDRSTGGTSTNATVRVYCMGSLIATYTGINLATTDDWVTVARVAYPSCVGMSVNDRTNGTSILPASFTSPRHCEIPCSSNADCPTGERCALVGGGGPPRNACILM